MKEFNGNSWQLIAAVICTILGNTAIAEESTPAKLNLQKYITLSGVSSGGYMANQFHLAHSDIVTGVGIISAGPYFCSQGNLMTAMGQCLANGSALVDKELTTVLKSQASKDNIAPLSNLQGDKIWLLHGALDKRVGRDVSNALYQQYQQITATDHIRYITNKAFNHHLPTLSFGVECEETATPFLGNCDYDAAGEMLSWMVAPQATNNVQNNVDGSFYTLSQPPKVQDKATGLADDAWLYVPLECSNGSSCQLHISFHGCQQNTASIGNDYVENGGFNPWADKLNLVVLYPQIAAGNAVNPLACWDWWGYSGSDFHTQSGPQIQAIKHLVDELMSGNAALVVMSQSDINPAQETEE